MPERYAGLAFLFGLISVLAFPPFGYSFLALLALVGLFWLWATKAHTGVQAFKFGLWFGLGQFGLGVSWLFSSVYFYSDVGLIAAIFIVIGFVLLLALFPALAGGLARWLHPAHSPTSYASWLFLCLTLPASWVLFELVRAHSFGGLPFLLIGGSQLNDLLDGFLPILGVFGVGFLLALMAGLLVSLWLTRWFVIGVVGLISLSLSAWFLQKVDWVAPTAEPVKVALVQGNIAQDIKWQASRFVPMVRDYVALTRENWDADLIVWPETAIPGYYDQASRLVLRNLIREAMASDKDVLVGAISRVPETDIYYNAMINLRDDSQQYHKRHLVMFGEYYPFAGLLKSLADRLGFPFSQFSAGALDQPMMQLAGHSVGVSICFEMMFGAELARDVAQARYFVTTSNDAWFAHTFEPAQLRHESQLRARELGREIARATNTGYTVIIDTKGQIKYEIPAYEVGVLRGYIQPYQGITPYARWTNWPVWLSVLLILAYMSWRKYRR
ncbi:apolipoprotein N-acyltransferase [Thiomicrospira sp. R3]|uniref:apolipoprotein N-acyltransferase n=1 Tax=Thiomicrospira sp. R3 TaxID=3035472 RepID=UPI00259B0507|nr:apolipoprotein N-acyltransferase [Thiomicrospira sp. R3]WFE68147.1 apolipoprotein N-acyltransferase [Thiomicrospira sp. R3]